MLVSEVATLLGKSTRRVRKMISDGLLPAEKHGRDWWITEGNAKEFAAKDRPIGYPKGKPRKEKKLSQ